MYKAGTGMCVWGWNVDGYFKSLKPQTEIVSDSWSSVFDSCKNGPKLGIWFHLGRNGFGYSMRQMKCTQILMIIFYSEEFLAQIFF
jgi:hypothetical protein